MSESRILTGLEADAPVSPAGVPDNDCRADSMAVPGVFAHAGIFQVVFSFAAMLATCLVGRVFLSLRSFQIDPDLWWHIKVGEDILATHRWPTTDAYSFTVAG